MRNRHSHTTLLDEGIDLKYIKDLPGHLTMNDRNVPTSKENINKYTQPLDDLTKNITLVWYWLYATDNSGKED